MNKYKITVKIDFLGQELTHEAVQMADNEQTAKQTIKEFYADNYGTYPDEIKILSIKKI